MKRWCQDWNNYWNRTSKGTHRDTTWITFRITRCNSSNRSCHHVREPHLATPKRCVLDVEGTLAESTSSRKMLHRKASTVFRSTCVCETSVWIWWMDSITFCSFSVGLDHAESENHILKGQTLELRWKSIWLCPTTFRHAVSCPASQISSHLPNPPKNGANTEPSWFLAQPGRLDDSASFHTWLHYHTLSLSLAILSLITLFSLYSPFSFDKSNSTNFTFHLQELLFLIHLLF